MVWNVRESQLGVKTEFPHKTRLIEPVWIPMLDGVRLSARIWLPEDAEHAPVPALLEYIPYRKNDCTALRDSIRHPYFAGHGYASVRVDIRGSGDSEGIPQDEYHQQEQDDALDVIDWLAHQPWCSGAVGMFGKSWGGFNALQVAARRPPALKAILTLCSTDDRYADDVHYRGGCLLASDMLWWASYMLAWNARPPDPTVVGERWRTMWLERLENTPPFVENWMHHQRRDGFWQHGSICEDWSAIQCPVFAVGGWSDGYTNSILRMLEHLNVPRMGLIGPWSHEYPEAAIPGPAIGFLQEALRWWDHWLKGVDTGIMDEPMLRAYLQNSVAPAPYYDWREGRWAAELAWPMVDGEVQELWLEDGNQLNSGTVGNGTISSKSMSSPQTHGLYSGKWCPFGAHGDWPTDQRVDDGLALCFEGDPTDTVVEYLGFPKVTLTVSSDQPWALLALRLCDVAPDGSSTLVSNGVLNLTHRESHESPSALEPGQPYVVTIQLDAIGYRLLPGHHWRLALAPTYWPRLWPAPQPVILTLHLDAGCVLLLPLRRAKAADSALHFDQPEAAQVMVRESIRPEQRSRRIENDLNHGRTILTDFSDEGLQRLGGETISSGLEFGTLLNDTWSISEGDPLSAQVRCERSAVIGRTGWQTRIDTVSTMSANADYFHLTNQVEAYEGEHRIFVKTWAVKIQREFV